MPLLMCPNCQASMQAVQRSGVEFDMCPNCRGVWLDRGELEKLVGHAREYEPPSKFSEDSQPRPAPYPKAETRRRDYDDDEDDYHRRGGKRKRGLDIFDIFD